jgi:hypothetical protein
VILRLGAFKTNSRNVICAFLMRPFFLGGGEVGGWGTGAQWGEWNEWGGWGENNAKFTQAMCREGGNGGASAWGDTSLWDLATAGAVCSDGSCLQC